MQKKLDIDEHKLSGYDGIASAVVLQAVADWRWLYEHFETNIRNYSELEYFFKSRYFALLVGSQDTADYIFIELQKERKKSGF